MTTERKVVWVLGAGFSRGLGGPLLRDLFTIPMHENVRLTYARDEVATDRCCSDMAKQIYWLYHYGRKFVDGVPFEQKFGKGEGGQPLWEDAEQFLDYLDTAADGEAQNATNHRGAAALRIDAIRELSGYSDKSVELVSNVAKQLMAAECCVFLEHADPTAERWQPYTDWLSRLAGQTDTIITFNYDRALETIDQGNGHIKVIDSSDAWEEAQNVRRVPVLKLHGSVDWKNRTADQGFGFRSTGSRSFAVRCEPGEVAIAAPGPSKKNARTQFGFLWTRAIRALEQADAIVFLGYRFPPTDAEARVRLLGALRENERRELHVHTVLGPDLGDVWSVRMHHLLLAAQESANRRQGFARDVVRHAMYAEDFFTVWSWEGLFGL